MLRLSPGTTRLSVSLQASSVDIGWCCHSHLRCRPSIRGRYHPPSRLSICAVVPVRCVRIVIGGEHRSGALSRLWAAGRHRAIHSGGSTGVRTRSVSAQWSTSARDLSKEGNSVGDVTSRQPISLVPVVMRVKQVTHGDARQHQPTIHSLQESFGRVVPVPRVAWPVRYSNK